MELTYYTAKIVIKDAKIIAQPPFFDYFYGLLNINPIKINLLFKIKYIMPIRELQPAAIWNYFYDITQIPRPSKKEEAILSYLLDFAKKHNLDAKQDKAGNIIITKEATPGKEKLPTLILQSHVDMVCEKNSDVEHDFDNDPIETVIDGDWVKAKGTTLGADNGLGVAAELAI